MKNCVIVYNPESGRGIKNIENKSLQEIAKKHGIVENTKNLDISLVN